MEKTLRLSAEQRDDLVAYLDGELPEEKASEIDTILARSEVARHEVEALARTWELLDSLPVPKASGQFLERTMTTLQLKEIQGAKFLGSLEGKAKVTAVALAWTALILISTWMGFQLTHRWIPNPTEQILNDLPMVQNFDLYQEIYSTEFLDELKKRQVFDLSSSFESDGRSTVVPMDASVPNRVRFVEGMTEHERDQFKRNLADFQKLPLAEQERVRKLHADLLAGGATYSSIVREYSNWISTLTPLQRSDLIKEIRTIEKAAIVTRIRHDEQQKLLDSITGKESDSLSNQDKDPNLRVPSDGIDPRRGPLRNGPFGGRPPALSRAELESLIKIIAEDAKTSADVSSDQNRFRSYHEVIAESVRKSGLGPKEWPSSSLQQQIRPFIEKSSVADHFNQVQRDAKSEREAMARILFEGILVQSREQTAKNWRELVTKEQLQQIRENPGGEQFNKINQDYFDRFGEYPNQSFDELEKYART
ncbi:MAG: hypothetical protein FJ267_09985, partial [Planctomycetes bacterium]|nr:hypothetical protein [Planctomycetota bacterium]